MRTIRLEDIKIKDSFANSIPSDKKMKECRDNWEKYHRQDRFIVINHDGFLVDGYIQYLILKENGIEEAEIKIFNFKKNRWHRKNVRDWDTSHYRNEETIYVYGKHWNAKNQQYSKEYMWRVPKVWKNSGLYHKLEIGGKILVKTKFGVKVVTITRIEWHNECPIDMPVRRILKIFDNENADELTVTESIDVIKDAVNRISNNCEEKQGVDNYSIYDDVNVINSALRSIKDVQKMR